MRLAALALLSMLALTACNRAADKAKPAQAPGVAPAETVVGFQHESGFDAQGYYHPITPVAAAGLRLTHIGIGSPSDFEAWEAGKREEVFGPILVQFEAPADIAADAKAPPPAGAAHADNHPLVVKILPQAYRITPGRLNFRGSDPKLGEVDFDGALDPRALASARTTGNSESEPVLTGTLRIDGQPPQVMTFSYWAGD